MGGGVQFVHVTFNPYRESIPAIQVVHHSLKLLAMIEMISLK
jgi:hypothetical protein